MKKFNITRLSQAVGGVSFMLGIYNTIANRENKEKFIKLQQTTEAVHKNTEEMKANQEAENLLEELADLNDNIRRSIEASERLQQQFSECKTTEERVELCKQNSELLKENATTLQEIVEKLLPFERKGGSNNFWD